MEHLANVQAMTVQPVFTHPWDVSPAEAREIQHQLRGRVLAEPLNHQPEIVAGIDVSVKTGQGRAAVVLLSYPDLVPFQATTAERPISFPYVPGLLAFREGPIVLEALQKLEDRPDVLMFDAQGLAHPRRMGLATHLGILLDMPTVGCAKSRLCGNHAEPKEQKGSWTPLRDGNEVIGAVVRTRDNVRPVFVSTGHRVDLKTAISLVLDCAIKYRLPEPTRWAHKVAGGESLPAVRQPTSLGL
jgi:deoxyribonuclease V